MTTRSKRPGKSTGKRSSKAPVGSFARAKRSNATRRQAKARPSASQPQQSIRALTTEGESRFANRNEIVAQPSRPSAPATGVRLQKVLADAGIAARRDCEQLILDGRIQVNGKPVLELPCFIDPDKDVVARDGVPIDISASLFTNRADKSSHGEQHTYLLINKPKGMITTARDPQGRPTVLQMVPHSIAERERLFPVGRLDADSTGLLLLTNDGDLAYQLTHPKFGVLKEYLVTTTGMASDEQIALLKKGMYLMTPNAGGPTRSKKASVESVRVLKRFVDRNRGDRSILSIKLREGQNREIRRLLARIGLKVRDLERTAIGPLRTGTLKPGQSKLLGKRDVEKLRAALLSQS